MEKSVFIRLFAGVAPDCFDAVPLIPFGQWLLPAGIFLLLTGFRAERNKKAGMLSLYRHKTALRWWKRQFGQGILSGLWTALLLLLMVLAFDLAVGNTSGLSVETVFEISTLWLFHMISMTSLFLLFDLFSIRRFIPGMLLLLEGLTFLAGYRVHAVSQVMYGMWGMYLQSSLCKTGGFLAEAAIAAEAVLLTASFFIGKKYLNRYQTNII